MEGASSGRPTSKAEIDIRRNSLRIQLPKTRARRHSTLPGEALPTKSALESIFLPQAIPNITQCPKSPKKGHSRSSFLGKSPAERKRGCQYRCYPVKVKKEGVE